jgi:Domain of unknown function (DUF4402)
VIIRNILLVGCLLFSFSAQTAQAQTLSSPTDINFGQIIVGGPGTIKVESNSDTRSTTGSVALVGFALVQRGRVTITHTPGAQVSISVPASIVLTGANSPTLVPTIEGGAIQTIPVSGTLTVFFGGTLTFSTFGSYGVTTAVVPVTVDPI